MIISISSKEIKKTLWSIKYLSVTCMPGSCRFQNKIFKAVQKKIDVEHRLEKVQKLPLKYLKAIHGRIIKEIYLEYSDVIEEFILNSLKRGGVSEATLCSQVRRYISNCIYDTIEGKLVANFYSQWISDEISREGPSSS